MFMYKLRYNDTLNQRIMNKILISKDWKQYQKRESKLDPFIDTLLDFIDTDNLPSITIKEVDPPRIIIQERPVEVKVEEVKKIEEKGPTINIKKKIKKEIPMKAHDVDLDVNIKKLGE